MNWHTITTVLERLFQQYLRFLGKVVASLDPLGTDITVIVARAAAETLSEMYGFTEEQQQDIHERANQASEHLKSAGKILTELQIQLSDQNDELTNLLNSIDTNKREAEEWKRLASANEESAAFLLEKLQQRTKENTLAELKRDRPKRILRTISSFLITLLIGAVVGALFQQWWQTGNALAPWLLPTPTPFP